jgi:diguanylate cyclase
MFFKKNSPPEKETPKEASNQNQYVERVSRILLVCVEGIQKLIEQADPIFKTLDELKEVIKKAVRPKPHTGIAKDLEKFFERWLLDKKFRETKNDAINQIVNGLAETVQGVIKSSSKFDESMGDCIIKIENAEQEAEIIVLKDMIIKEIQRARENSREMSIELDGYRKTTRSLAAKLQHTEAKALVDPLTNVLNRNAYNMKISQMVNAYTDFGEVFAILVVDIDHFKKFNDNYGHRAGDRVLNSVATSLKSCLRASDMIFRYGGEEFVIILKSIILEDAGKIALKLRKHIEKDYFVDKDRQLKVTISIGCTVIREGDTEESLFERADKALYEAKDKGRNRIEISS